MIVPTPAEIIALGACIPFLVVVMVTLRFVSKSKSFRNGLRALLIVLCGLLIAGTVQKGYGHQADTHTSQQGFEDQSTVLERTKRYTDFHDFFQGFVFGMTKLSVLFFYRQIFVGKAFNICSWTLIAMCALWTIFSFFFDLLQCGSHVEYLYSSAANVASHCLSGEKIALPLAITDFLTDLFILVLPLFWVSRLRMSCWRKLAVCAIFMFGAITMGSSATRLAMVAIVFPKHNSKADQLAYLTVVAYWSDLEGGLCITAACLPTLAPLFAGTGRNGSTPGDTLSYYLEHGWCTLTRREPSRRVLDSNPGSRNYSSKRGLATFSSQMRNDSQSSASATQQLVSSATTCHAYPLHDLEQPAQHGLDNFWTEMEDGNVLVTRDITVEHQRVRGGSEGLKSPC